MSVGILGTNIGVLGGGQLGRMLMQAALNFDVRMKFLDSNAQAPCNSFNHFISTGHTTDYTSVLNFGMAADLLTIEIENVNTDALFELQDLGKKIYPQPKIIELVKDKRRQKAFYQKAGFPTASYITVENRYEITTCFSEQKPVVNKIAQEGYDGRGVKVLKKETDLNKAFDAPGILEDFVSVKKELSVIVARNSNGQVRSFPTTEMIFDPEANLLDYLQSPADITPGVNNAAQELAKELVSELEMVGLLAVELFLTQDDKLLINEIAPRPHNSGHHTIEGNYTSQFEQHLRAILNLPLGDTSQLMPTLMVNLLGDPEHKGPVIYQGLDEVLALRGVHVHLYGKVTTKPRRKMGHITIRSNSRKELLTKAQYIKKTLKAVTNDA